MQRNKVYHGDSREVLKLFPDNSVDCSITSPPFFGLRDYGTGKWVGGDAECEHSGGGHNQVAQTKYRVSESVVTSRGSRGGGDRCVKCGAERVDKQIGLEITPERYVYNLVKVFDEVKRVLRPHGTLWLNLGDSYAGGGRAGNNPDYHKVHKMFGKDGHNPGVFGKVQKVPDGLKAKDIIGIPWRMAFALQGFAVVPFYRFSSWSNMLIKAMEVKDWELVKFVQMMLLSMDLLNGLQESGWYLRQDIIWSKPNPMPESVTDRCVKSHEYIFQLSKSKNYYFDHEIIKERATGLNPGNKKPVRAEGNYHKKGTVSANLHLIGAKEVRNKRSVWHVATQPFAKAHFATFPPKLIRPIILAATSHEGYCPHCHKPWVRVIEKEVNYTHDGNSKTLYDNLSSAGRLAKLRQEARRRGVEYSNYTRTMGWNPSCKCEGNVPCTGYYT